MSDNDRIVSWPRRVVRGLLAAVLAGLAIMPGGAALAGSIPGGFLSQPTGRSSCINDEGASHCLQGRGFGSSFGITIDPSGQHAYATSFSQPNGAGHSLGTLAVLDRFPSAASLLQSGNPASCASTGGLDNCVAGRGLLGALTSAVTPDGKNVYVATQNGVASFSRDPDTGRVTQLVGLAGCLNEDGNDGCQPARMVQDASGVVVSPDGRHVYVSAYGPSPIRDPLKPTRSGVAVFDRDASTGDLTQLPIQHGCVSDDGASGCSTASGLLGASSLALSPDGATLYVGAIRLSDRGEQSGAVVALAVDQATGALTPIIGRGGCLAQGPVADCEQGRGMLGITSVIAPDNKTVYAVGNFSSSVVLLRRATNGRIFQPSTGTDGADGCTSATGADGCATAPSLVGARSAVASSDGFNLYVAGGSTVSAFLRSDRGRLVQLRGRFGCISQGGNGDTTDSRCFTGHGLIGTQSLAIDPLGRNVYVATSGSFGASAPGGGVVTLTRNARPAQLTITARLLTASCRAKQFVVDLRASSPLQVQLSAKIDGRSAGRLPSGSSLRLTIQASAYKPGRHRIVATARDITGRVRNTSTSFRRCR